MKVGVAKEGFFKEVQFDLSLNALVRYREARRTPNEPRGKAPSVCRAVRRPLVCQGAWSWWKPGA